MKMKLRPGLSDSTEHDEKLKCMSPKSILVEVRVVHFECLYLLNENVVIVLKHTADSSKAKIFILKVSNLI